MTDYNKFCEKKKDVSNVVEAEHVDNVRNVEAENVMGSVNCDYLNIRSYPDVNEDNVVDVLTRNATVQIDQDYESDDWYHIYLISGVDGYAMKVYIDMK